MDSDDAAVRRKLRERAAMLRTWTSQAGEQVSSRVQQRLIDGEVRATRTALLRHIRLRYGTDTAVLFDPELRTLADETTAVQAVLRAAGATADSCDLQLRDHHDGTLRIRAQHGFSPVFLTAFQAVATGDPTACAAALATGRAVLVDDVTRSPIFAGQPSLDILLDAGSRSVASYPLHAADGTVFGVLSFHHRGVRLGHRGHEALVTQGTASVLGQLLNGHGRRPGSDADRSDDRAAGRHPDAAGGAAAL